VRLRVCKGTGDGEEGAAVAASQSLLTFVVSRKIGFGRGDLLTRRHENRPEVLFGPLGSKSWGRLRMIGPG
jgi:hypothetical protein